jgi:DNA repair exonuclease SbcCD ATPase subunit
MIMFEIVRWKNFLSTGNNTTEIQLNKTKSTLIVGHNGAGKSTMLDAISFGLFGKPHRSITKPQLLNSVNNKNCLVEVEFSSGKNKYKIVRGIKPTIFEIWKNGTMINQSSHAKEYQKILEQNILKLNHKSFHQIVVLGSGSFIPFMQLPGGHRREVIEDLLDINVFSRMNQLCKEQYSIIKESLRTNQYELDINNNRIDTQKKYIKDVKILTEQNLASKEAKISEHNTEIESLEKENTSLAAEIDSKQGPIESRLNELHDKKQSLLQYNSTFRSQMNNITKEAKFYEDNESCPTCSQDIDEILRNEKLSSAKAKAKELKSAMDSASLESTAVEQSIEQVTADLTDIREKQQIIHSNSRQISSLRVQIDSIKGELETSAVADLNDAHKELKNLEQTRNSFMETKFALNEKQQYNQVILEMLKDTGIKTKIIKQYLPAINQLVNNYLQTLDFFIHFNLDESFQETLRSRHRDAFTYASFSEGEKQRIDLALLFTWRQVAKMKNSVATNLLILDETFDSSLDHDGVDNLMKILYSLEDDTNTFVISHKGEILDGKFQEKLEFVKDRNFSKIKT